MTLEPSWTVTSVSNRLGALPRWVVPAAVIVVTFVGIHGTAHVLVAPERHLDVSKTSMLIVLWGVTTLVASAGLAASAKAYTSLVDQLASEPRIRLGILPDDERRILEPILETPGITQVEVVARSDFSDAKVSQTLKALRQRGLVYREPQGRTYRLYPGTALDEAIDEP